MGRAVMRLWVFLFALFFFALGLGVVTKAPCSENACFGGMCMDSAACAPGCHCIGGRCG